jgi:RNA polymerase sigma-70 factor (ECF subfamily)
MTGRDIGGQFYHERRCLDDAQTAASRKNLAEKPDSSVLGRDMTTDAPPLRGRAPWMPRDLPSPPRAADAVPAPTSVAATAASDEHAGFVRALFERHRHALLRYLKGLLANNADAEDALQEAYARLLDVVDLDKTEGRARAYLYKVATNLARDRFRRRRDSSIDDAAADELASGEDPPEVVVDFGRGLAVVKKTLLELKPRCRQVFLLRVAEDLDYESIAARLGISKRTVEREMQHALDVCQRRLERSGT